MPTKKSKWFKHDWERARDSRKPPAGNFLFGFLFMPRWLVREQRSQPYTNGQDQKPGKAKGAGSLWRKPLERPRDSLQSIRVQQGNIEDRFQLQIPDKEHRQSKAQGQYQSLVHWKQAESTGTGPRDHSGSLTGDRMSDLTQVKGEPRTWGQARAHLLKLFDTL